MALSPDALARLCIALASADAGNEVASALNAGLADGASPAAFASQWCPVLINLDAAASTAFVGLLAGDLVVDFTTVANNIQSKMLVTTADTLAFTPTLHDVLVVFRWLPASNQSVWTAMFVNQNHPGSTTAQAGVLPGDYVLDLVTVANNVLAKVPVVTANTLAFTPTAADSLLVLRRGRQSGAQLAAPIIIGIQPASTLLAGVQTGDLAVDLVTVADNVAAKLSTLLNNTLAYTPVVSDSILVLRPVSVPAPAAFKF